MFFFIGGIQPRTVVLKTHDQSCPRCCYSPVELKRVDHYLSLFFIPLFPVKRGKPFLFCPGCQSEVDPETENSHPDNPHTQQRCRFCQRSFPREYSFCPYCGRPVSK